ATMLALKKLDKKIPQDIALVTFDNIEIFEMTDPPITAVAQPQEEIAKKAVELLMQCIKDEELLKRPQIYTLKTKIIHRKSV
ncbi:MAG: substrate-binding domain-containing protein, partial [Bacteroidales bacterium]|nr:substrate-binding domain-containing protein [Bacteroidales bacterium]